MTVTPHTPTPWKVHDNGVYIEIMPEEWSEGIPIAIGNVCSSYPSDKDQGLQRANAEHIVNCVNLHDSLVGYLNICLEILENEGGRKRLCDDIYEVLAKAGVF